MSYFDGVVIPVPTKNKAAYLAMAEKMAEMFKANGAEQIVEGWGHDVPEGEVTSLSKAVLREEDETVVFSWIRWPSKEVRDAAWGVISQSPEMTEMEPVFDGKRMIFGGFDVLMEA